MLLEPIDTFAILTKHIENLPVGTAMQCDVSVADVPPDAENPTTEIVIKLQIGPWPVSQHSILRAGIEDLQ